MLPIEPDPRWLVDKALDVALALLIFAIGWMLARWAYKIVIGAFRARRHDPAAGRFLANLARYAVLVAAGIGALDAVGVRTISVAAVVASVGVAVGLAMQGSLSNFASGVLILVLRPFDLGQYVSVAGQAGTVTDIGLFATTLTGVGNEQVIIPNAQITSNVITNFAALPYRRGSVKLTLAHGSDVDRAEEVLLGAARSLERVLGEPAPFVRLTSLGPSGLEFELFAYARREDLGLMLHELHRAVYVAVAEAGLEIPMGRILVPDPP